MPMRVFLQCLLLAFVPDGITSPQSDPLWDRSVLLLGSGELHLCAEGLVALRNTLISICSPISDAKIRQISKPSLSPQRPAS
ncbi:hypothetical protein QTJ16_001637 [Diplocarpon rosae]|uniref:Secreted protein n=1 Tax=Diplocarpon rosae TaxID=946125 RepID=A0AAD9WGS0_9HELO|nr:hypothetical protein QTJ16_001637 [Diplocarpon rosae]